MPAAVIVSWIAANARSEGLAVAFDATPHFMPWARPGGGRLGTMAGWVRSAARTWRVVRPLPAGSVVVVMCPPVFAALSALAAARIGRRRRPLKVVLDAHSGAFNDDRWRWSFGLMAWAVRKADTLLVTNRELLEGVDVGSTPVEVLHDPPLSVPEVDGPPPVELPPVPWVLFPASGAPDEPMGAVAAAAAELAGEVAIVVTGRQRPELADAGLHLTGFLPVADYRALLASAPAVLALTTRSHTMQRAAYEAVVAGRPLVVSDHAVLRRTVGPAAVVCQNTGPAIAAAVRTALATGADLAARTPAVHADLHGGLPGVRDRVLGGRAA